MECDNKDLDVDAMLTEAMRDLPEEEFTIPDGFEELVMRQIRALPEPKKYAATLDTLLCVIWGSFSCLFGLGVLAVMNRTAIMAYIASNPVLSGYADTFAALSGYVDAIADEAIVFVSGALTSLSGYISASRYVLMLIIAVLVMIQYVVYRKNKVKA